MRSEMPYAREGNAVFEHLRTRANYSSLRQRGKELILIKLGWEQFRAVSSLVFLGDQGRDTKRKRCGFPFVIRKFF